MTIGDLIKDKDYSRINFRFTHPLFKNGIFFGVCKSANGKLIPLDGDTIYDENDEVIEYEEFEKDKETCLEVLVKGEWVNW